MKFTWYTDAPRYINTSVALKKLKKEFSEQDIIRFQALLLRKGVHTLSIKNVRKGRLLIYTCLETLNCFKRVGCLTLSSIHLKAPVVDIIASMNTALEDFFIEEFDFDFLWIESSNNLTKTVWFTRFKSLLYEAGIPNHIPIIYF